MKKSFLRFAAGATGLCVFAAHAAGPTKFVLASPDVAPDKPIANAHVLNAFGCTGENKSPRFKWSGAPAGTKSFVLTAYDPDAPTGSGWWHWVVLDIPASAVELPGAIGQGGALPVGAREGRTDMGKPGYMGPCPPQGAKAHRYVYTLHALKVEKLDLGDDATPALVGFMVDANRIGRASFTVKQAR